MSKRKTIAEFIEQAKAFHGDKFDYSKTEYINTKTKIIIICKKGNHEFLQNPKEHLRSGCYQCCSKKKMTNESFLEKAKLIHGDKYEYSKVEYVNSKTKVIITCKIHGEFLQTPVNHLNGKGCKLCCYLRQTKTQEQFIADGKALFGDKYDYSKVQYINDATKVTIGCKIHGFFEQLPHNHLTKGRTGACKKCGVASYTKSGKQFIEDANIIHNNKYNYSKVEYINNKTKVIIICLEHGEFSQKPDNHLGQRSGCPNCLYKTEKILYEKIISYFPTIIRQYRVEWCKNIFCLPFDFCIEQHKIIIELDGIQHRKQVNNWSSPEDNMERDKFKQQCANQNGYSVIRILQEDVLNDKHNWFDKLLESIKSIIDEKIVKNVYLHNKGEYDTFIELLNT